MLKLLVTLASVVALVHYSLKLLLKAFAPRPAPPTKASLTYLSASHPCPPGLPLPSALSPATVELSIVVPAYNETARLRSGLADALQWLEARRYRYVSEGKGGKGWRSGSYEVVIVDDGSTDDTIGVALELAKEHAASVAMQGEGEIRVVALGKNRGKGGAVRHGVMHCRGHRILFADADGASRFSDLDLLLASMDSIRTFSPSPYDPSTPPSSSSLPPAEEEHALVLGSRAHLVSTPSVVSRSPLRNFLMRSFHLYLYLLGVRTVRDTQCGFKLIARATARDVVGALHVEGWIFDVELILLAGLTSPPTPTSEVPITWTEVSGSKLSVARDSLVMAVELLVIRLCYGLGVWQVPGRGGESSAAATGQEKKKDR